MDQDIEEARRLRSDLTSMNSRWESICNKASGRQKDLQVALMQCDDFDQTIRDLLAWLETIEAQIRLLEPVDLESDHESLRKKYIKFVVSIGTLYLHYIQIL
jgi:molybdenum cofactor biosynthesis enzyme MoaA